MKIPNSHLTWCLSLRSVLQITPFLSDVALHLFLQTALAVKEMDRVLSGKDNREISEIIIPDHKPCQREREGRKSSAFRDSGYSGSLHDGTPDVELEGASQNQMPCTQVPKSSQERQPSPDALFEAAP